MRDNLHQPTTIADIIFCKRCLYSSNHPLGLTIDEDGICSGCRIHEEKDTLDWAERLDALKILVEPYRSISGKNYDCIVPVSGASDSYYIVHIVKNILKLNPLLVSYNKYWNTNEGIYNLANLRITFDCDIIIQNVNINSVKKIVKTTLTNFGSIYWHCIAGQTVFPVQIAQKYRVPLIIWGAHQGIEQVGMYSHLHEVEMTRRYRKDHDLMGMEADSLSDIFNNLDEYDTWQFEYPSDFELNQNGTRGIYLSNYIRWDPLAQHKKMVNLYNYHSRTFSRTFDIYDFADCHNYMGLHDKLKLIKHGYSKVTDHACREIRHKRLTRSQGLKLVKRYEKQNYKGSKIFNEWIGMKQNSLEWLLSKWHNPLFLNKRDCKNYVLRTLAEQIQETYSQQYCHTGNLDDEYILNPLELNFGGNENYILFGKGY